MKKSVEILNNRIDDINQKISAILQLPQDDLMAEIYHNQIIQLTQELKKNEEWLEEAINPTRAGRPRIHEQKEKVFDVRGRPARKKLEDGDQKYCYRCKSIKKVSNFYKSNNSPTGYSSECKACRKEINAKKYDVEYHQKYRKENHEKVLEIQKKSILKLKTENPELYKERTRKIMARYNQRKKMKKQQEEQNEN